MKIKFIRNSLIFALVVGLLLTLDLLLKNYFFIEQPNDMAGPIQHDWKVIGIRSFAHTNSTFLSFINVSISQATQIAIGFTISSLLIIWLLFSKSKTQVVGLAIMISGVLGNTFDSTIFGYVRDILFTPWWDRGTFNPADVFIICGAALLFIGLIMELVKKG